MCLLIADFPVLNPTNSSSPSVSPTFSQEPSADESLVSLRQFRPVCLPVLIPAERLAKREAAISVVARAFTVQRFLPQPLPHRHILPFLQPHRSILRFLQPFLRVFLRLCPVRRRLLPFATKRKRSRKAEASLDVASVVERVEASPEAASVVGQG
jgi:hypothetical protein